MLSRIRIVLATQLLLVLLTSVVFFLMSGGFQAGSAGFGGAIALINVLLLEWRRYQTDKGRSALERLLLVALLFALGMGALALDPRALLTGFVMGQVALLLTGTKRTD